MILTSDGQMANDLAKMLYRHARQFVNSLVELGKISPSEAEVVFAKEVAKSFAQYGLTLSKALARLAGLL